MGFSAAMMKDWECPSRRNKEPMKPAARHRERYRYIGAAIMQSSLIKKSRIHIGSMNCSVTTGTPAGALPEIGTVRNFPDVNLSFGRSGSRVLCMALQTKVRIPFNQHFGIH